MNPSTALARVLVDELVRGGAEGEERGRALVDAHVQPQPPGGVRVVQGEGQRRRPRPR